MSKQYQKQKLKWKEVGKQETLKQVEKILDETFSEDWRLAFKGLKQKLEKLK